jgi:hypothetical protein
MYKTYASAPLLTDPPAELRDYILANARKTLDIPGRAESDVFDLFPFYSILVSSGGNKNTDVFDPLEMWRARHSPEDKPLNYMHDQKRIIGHITNCITVGEDLKPLPEDMPESALPSKLHIITSNVIYAISDDKYQQDFLNDLMGRITKGNLFVSLECLFRKFDFLLQNSKGEQKLVAHNDKTAYLTKFLRQYKGTGKVDGYSIWRLLRDITFSAVGLVDNPANPDSIISDNLDVFNTNASNVGYIILDQSIGEIVMPETKADDTGGTNEAYADIENHPKFKDLKDKHDRLALDHANLNDRADKMKQQLDNIHEHTMAKEEKDKADLEKEVASLRDELNALKVQADKAMKDKDDMDEACKAAKASVTAMQGDNDAMKATIDAYKKAERGAARTEALMLADTKLTREVAAKMVADAGEVTDTAFAVMVNAITNYASRAPKEVTAETVLSTSKAEEGANVTLGNKDTNTLESTRAQISNWLKPQLHGKGDK